MTMSTKSTAPVRESDVDATKAPTRNPSPDVPSSKTADTTLSGCNVAVALGSISSDVQMRTLPSGTELASFSISVSHATGPTTSMPVSWPTPTAAVLARLEPGTEVLAVGRIVRRFYRAGGATQSRTELVVDRVERLSRRVACRRIVEQAIADLEATVSERLL